MLLGGCISSKSYVDPSFARATYEDVQIPPMPYELKISVEFQRNGEHLPQVDGELRGIVERVIRASRFAVPAAGASQGELKVVVNNIADLDKARAMGFGTGMTFGAAGSYITDYYEMAADLTLDGKTFSQSGYKHQLHTTVGNKAGPEGVAPTTPSAGFATIVEQLLLNFLKDMKQGGLAS
jgi:hypothetical protein